MKQKPCESCRKLTDQLYNSQHVNVSLSAHNARLRAELDAIRWYLGRNEGEKAA